MAMLPDPHHLDIVEAKCREIFEAKFPDDTFSIAEELMTNQELPMHCPYHHEVSAAALWTSACIRENADSAFFEKGLSKIRERASTIPGAFCGQFGTCGAAVSTGIFAAVWLNTNPNSKESWGDVNSVSASALTKIASTDGPHCCKRVTYLAITGALPAIRERLHLDLGEVPVYKCTRSASNKTCIKAKCPYFPGEE